MLELHVFLLFLMYMFRGRSFERVWLCNYGTREARICVSDYSETVLWEWQQEKDTVCCEGDLLMICPFYPPPSRLAFVQMCLHSLLSFLFDVMLVVFALSVTCPLDLVRGSSGFIVLLPTCNSNKTSGGRVKQSCNKLSFSCIVVLIALQIIPVTFIMYLPFLFVFFSPKLFIATINVV